jgi:hypothetical protein
MRPLRLAGFALSALAVAPAACAVASRTATSRAPPGSSTFAAPRAGGARSTARDAGVAAGELTPEETPPPAGDAGAERVTPDATPVAIVEQADASSSPGDSGTGPASACNEQAPQDFLIRANFRKEGLAALQRAIQYRTDTYGYFKGFGHGGADAPAPSSYVVSTTFMDLPIKMHRKVVPALKCVEEEIKRACDGHPYTPRALAGIRFHNTYRGGEVTNHIYGIAIDIDPALNTCCGCVKPWNEAPACQRPAKTEYDRMAMPECWVHGFERYGFYWLGHDVLRDTMHFEFLGDPDRIVKDP